MLDFGLLFILCRSHFARNIIARYSVDMSLTVQCIGVVSVPVVAQSVSCAISVTVCCLLMFNLGRCM